MRNLSFETSNRDHGPSLKESREGEGIQELFDNRTYNPYGVFEVTESEKRDDDGS